MVAFRPGKKKRVIALTFLPSGHTLFRRIGREKQLRNFVQKQIFAGSHKNAGQAKNGIETAGK